MSFKTSTGPVCVTVWLNWLRAWGWPCTPDPWPYCERAHSWSPIIGPSKDISLMATKSTVVRLQGIDCTWWLLCKLPVHTVSWGWVLGAIIKWGCPPLGGSKCCLAMSQETIQNIIYSSQRNLRSLLLWALLSHWKQRQTHTVSPHLMSLVDSATYRETTYTETNFTTC